MAADSEDVEARHAQLEAILESAVDAIITIDEDGIVHSANPATERLFGYTHAEVIGQNVKLLMPAPYRDEHDGYLSNYRNSGIRRIIGIGREVTGRRKDGSVFPMHLAVSELNMGDRRLYTGIVRDISDLKEAEQKLTRLNEQLEERVRSRTQELRETQAVLVRKEKLATLGQVSGGIAHEIRNPLNAVKSSAYYLLNAQNASPEKMREHLERIDRQVTVIDNVITALSDVARLPDPQLKPADIVQHLKAVVSSVSLPDSVRIEWQLPENMPAALVDANQIPIVFRNLIRNARDAMPNGGTITLAATFQDGQLTVSVSDTGIGISSEDLTQILEPLYSTKARGMGLGLAISRAILDKNKADLRISSQPGVGSTFSVVLKATTADQKDPCDVP